MSSYEQTLADIQSAAGTVQPGSPEEKRGLDAFAELFADFSEANIRERLRDTYADSVYFNDTVKEIRTADQLLPYLVDSASAVEHCSVAIRDVAHHDGNYYVRWMMEIRFKSFKRGETTRSVGISHLRFAEDGKIVLHQDFWDSAGGLYEHIPVLGFMIRRIKARM